MVIENLERHFVIRCGKQTEENFIKKCKIKLLTNYAQIHQN